MKTSILVATIVACTLSAPIVSAQEKPAQAKPEINMDMENLMSPMQEQIS